MKLIIGSILLLTFFSCSKTEEGKLSSKYLAPPELNEAQVVAKAGDITITQAELNKGIEMDLYTAESKVFEIKNEKIKSILIEKFMAADPNKKNLTNDEFMDQFIAKTIQISPADINAFIKDKNIPAEHINDQIKERIKAFLVEGKKKEALDAWLASKMKGTELQVFITKPLRPKFDVKIGDAPFTGGSGAKVEIVEYSDFQCPFCAKGAELLKEIKAKYGDKVKFAFKHFPLPFHKQAQKASEAAMCAKEQKPETFWNMHDKMFADQSKLEIADLVATAVSLGLNKEAFEKCLSEDKYRAYIESNVKEGTDLGVRSTPTFYVNGQIVNGVQPIEVFAELIDEGLK